MKLNDKELDKEFDEIFVQWLKGDKTTGEMRDELKPFINTHYISKSKVEEKIIDEISICHKEGTPTSRLTSLMMKLKDDKS